MNAKRITGGPGLQDIHHGREPWYGMGYCGVCGARDDTLVPRRVRWYDRDDGWKTGVLCRYCAKDCRKRGPKRDDYAVSVGIVSLETVETLDSIAHILGDDMDGAESMSGDYLGD